MRLDLLVKLKYQTNTKNIVCWY